MIRLNGIDYFLTGEQARGIAGADLMLHKVKRYRLHELPNVNVKPRSPMIMIGLTNDVTLSTILMKVDVS